MKITRVEAATPANSQETAFQPHATGLSLVVAADEMLANRGHATLLGEALFGVAAPYAGATLPADATGEVGIQDASGQYRLRRQVDSNGVRLTIASESGRPADANTVERLTHGLSPNLLGRVFFWRRHDRGLLAGLLSDDVAAEYRRAVSGTPAPPTTPRWSTDDRLERRDALAAQIEALLAERRESSGRLEQAAADIETRIAELSGRHAEIERRLQAAQTELEEVETRLRYHAIAETAEREISGQPPADWAPQLDDIEAEITRWRATLADLEHREAALRGELAQTHPDDGSPVLSLADQRAAIAVATRLTQDLESEVARLARAADSNACVCQDAHPRLNPLVDTLGRQLRVLSDLADQQQRALRVQELEAESEHVARSQKDLRQQLDHLLKRRQELWRTGRPKRETRGIEHAAEAMDEIDLSALADRRADLQRQVVSLSTELEAADSELARLRHERELIGRERTGLLADSRLAELQRELEASQQSLRMPTAPPSADESLLVGQGRWRASELFAKLTDGRFRSLQLVAGGRDVVAVDTYGQERPSAALGDQDRDLAAASLMIAMAAGLAQHGVQLPLVFDEPFAMLDMRHAATLANVIEDYAHDGHQVLVFTGRREAIDRFATLGVLPLGHRTAVAPTTTPVTRVTRPTIAVEEAMTIVEPVAREYLLDHEDPIDRFPAIMANRRDVFARARVRTIGDLLSADPSALAEELDRDDVTAELVALWQTHLSLVCFVPGVTFDDAVTLTAAGVYSPEELADADADALLAELQRYLASDAGGRLRAKGYAADRSSVSGLISRAGRGVGHWRSTSHWDRWARHRGERRQRVATNASRRTKRGGSSTRLRLRTDEPRRTTEPRRTSKPKKKAPQRKFYLDVDSPIVDAPSIGPKTAGKLEGVGIRTVSDLLEADAAELAEQLDSRNVDAEKVVAWQHQAQLVCRIPLLRGHDAQIMVASGFTAPEEIASMKPSELLEFVEPFCSSADGQRVLRNSSPPDLDEVTNWIAWARESRTLGAA